MDSFTTKKLPISFKIVNQIKTFSLQKLNIYIYFHCIKQSFKFDKNYYWYYFIKLYCYCFTKTIGV